MEKLERNVAWYKRVPWFGFFSGALLAFGTAYWSKGEDAVAVVYWVFSAIAMAYAIERGVHIPPA